MPWLINPSQLEKFRKNQKNVVILDATWDLSLDNEEPKEAFETRHIVGARFFDIPALCEPEAVHSKMVTHDEERISHYLGALGISNDHKVIFYDRSKMRTSCRAVWMMKLFGHNPNQLYILDGGFAAWEQHGGKTESGEAKGGEKKYQATFQPQYLYNLEQMKANLLESTAQVLDVRNPVRFAGGPEKRPNLRAGHIPDSYCFPFMIMFEGDGRFKSLDHIKKQLLGIGIDLNLPIVTTCGSGTTAPILNFVLDLLGIEQNAVYNGSWTEWSCKELYSGEKELSERPVETCLTNE